MDLGSRFSRVSGVSGVSRVSRVSSSSGRLFTWLTGIVKRFLYIIL